jgi:hypothetical protein
MTDFDIDDAILSSVEPSWRKVAMIICKAAEILYGELPDGDEPYRLIGRRVEKLVENGRLQAQGDVKRWRHSEVHQAVTKH